MIEKTLKIKMINKNISDNNNMCDNNKLMKVLDFFNLIETDTKKPIYRVINIEYDKLGLYGDKNKKYATCDINKVDPKTNKPYCCERNHWDCKKIQEMRTTPDWLENLCQKGNSLSIYLKHIQDLYVVDYDVKDPDCEFYDLLNDDCVAMTDTTKGTHHYIKIKNIPKFTDQLRININKDVEMDLIKTNNIWEKNDRMVNGTIKEYDWNDIKKYFNVNKMFGNSSPPVSPPDSEDDNIDCKVIKIKKCNIEDFKKYIESFKPRYDYKSWCDVGMICFNNFDGDDIGFDFWNQYSKNDEENYEGKKALKNRYLTFNGDGEKKLSYKRFIEWAEIDYPSKNKYEGWYKLGMETFIENMNNECMYYTPTGDILYYSNNMYIRNKGLTARQFYCKYAFQVIKEDKKDKKEDKIEFKEEKINPFDIWINHIDRKDVDKIVFNPKNTHTETEFNIWKGYKYQNTAKPVLEKLKYFLNHIKHIWADDDEPTYNYILNWFSKIIQTPWKKNNICLVLHSVEGVGKSLILDMIGEIIGTDYYYSTSSLKHILGDFNGDAEGKILVNLNETNWGGDKKMVGAFKEFITDSRIVINKKGLQSYTIDNYSNTIITTNEDWIVSINGQDRRFNLRECKNVKYDKNYYKDIADTDIQEIANFFYNRDITEYDSREFEKSELHDLQVEKNMNSVESFWNNYIEGEILDPYYGFYNEEEENIITPKDHLFDLYTKDTTATHSHKYNRTHFWRNIRKLCPSIIINKARKDKTPSYLIPKLEIAQKEYKNYCSGG